MTTMTPDGRTVQVVYQDRRNAAVMTAVVELTAATPRSTSRCGWPPLTSGVPPRTTSASSACWT
jgi:hypothetical protein